jgi:PEGA domain-containing protein
MSRFRNQPALGRVFALALLLGALPRPGYAQSSRAPNDDNAMAVSDRIEQARELYLDGLRHVRDAHWAEALAAFERSRSLHPHAMTTYDIGACERALGNYTRAAEQLKRALVEEHASSELPPSVATEARAFIDEIEHLLVHIVLVVEPPGTSITFDGRPLRRDSIQTTRPRFVAGILAPGRGGEAPTSEFEVVADPGVHVITLSRPGYGDIVVNRSYRPGQSVAQRWALSELPATIRVSSNERLASVSVNGKDVGLAPVDVLRPAGVYRVEVTKSGFVHYAADVKVRPGEESTLRTTLVKESPSVLSKWWFWTAAATVVGTVATVTFLATRSEPRAERPPLDGGTLGWVAKIP